MAEKRGSYAKSGKRREALSSAALKLVQDKGHRNVTVGEVAELAGTSEPTVFYHFPTKESLLISALKQFDDDNIRAAGHEAGAIADMGHRAEVGVRRPHIPLLYAEMAGAAVDHENPANPYFQGRLARSLQVIATDIHRLQGEGKVDGAIDANMAARVLLACWEGLQFQWQHGPEFDIRTHLEWTIKAVLGPHALTPPQEQPDP
ncbi:TetR/AcrR family transcriptional regulator [Arthrobacter sp. M4]|uniref:TetR/AcrR family transcriptional regulator n=1 Tax=Arthrobacter sp. M4 TaxID=218160 RepID=UPI001CDB9827|nr:TetR/AcrR family transcriptional regulator [Arthrobacter sp. M4]MCA4132478.1 TetR/AcrR family transcriptional regulator [Arthrobacter sp. M4]